MIVFALALAGQVAIGSAERPPLLDGDCTDRQWQGAPRTELGEGVALMMLEDRAAVHLCLLLPPDSLGTFDLSFEDSAAER